EGVVVLVPLDLEHQEDRVDDEARDDEREQDNAEDEDERSNAPRVDDDPADVEDDGRRHQQDTEGDEESDGFLASGHIGILGQKSKGKRQSYLCLLTLAL